MREGTLPPNAPALLASLRAIGYSFDSALADIVDNSIAAKARSVDVEVRTADHRYVAIIDDGVGMTADQLMAAMQHGGVGPDAARDPGDLGRFGLGLKTASLSQCRRLTVATRRNNATSGARWDLDRVEATGAWTLGVLEPADFEGFPHLDRVLNAGHGTVVLWEGFDRALAGEADPDGALETLVDRAREHLSLVFHRYVKGGATTPQVAMGINGLKIEATDPFLASMSTELPSQRLKVDGHPIVFTPFILPHRSRLSKRQLEQLDGADGLRRTQGFYVYRNQRLITSGTWFRLMRQQELTKLARVRVDIPNALDHLRQLDVKKATAIPPHEVRAGLLQVIDQIGGTSKRVYTHRGWKQKSAIARVWDRIETAAGVSYRVNKSHPGVAAVASRLEGSHQKAVADLIHTLEMTLPFDAIYADMASDRDVAPDFAADELKDHLRGTLEAIIGALRGHPDALQAALGQVPVMEPFSSHPEQTRQLLQEVQR